MKKRLIPALCLVLALLLTAMPAMAAGYVSVSLSAGSSSAAEGDTVNFTVYAEVDSCGSGGVEVSFDSSVFEMVSGSCNISGTDLSYFDPAARDGAFAFSGTGSVSGGAFQFVLKVKKGAPAGSHRVSVTFSADGMTDSASATVTLACSHKYDNGCDESCNNCGETREGNHSWNSGTVTKEPTCSEKGEKTVKCTSCGKTRTESVDTLDHNYEVTAYAPATCQARGEMTFTCVDCGWSYDDYIEQRDHTYDNDCDEDCNVCGETRDIEHDYGEEWQNDATGHWQLCALCGVATEAEPHTPGPEATETEDQICLDCEFVIEPAGSHVHGEEGNWLSNAEKHWYMCSCGELMGEEEHDFVLEADRSNAQKEIYRCTVCSRTRHVSIETTAPEETTVPTEAPTEVPAEVPTETTVPVAELPVGFTFSWWWILAAVILIPMVGFCVYVIIGLIIGFSKKGKFDAKKKK